MVSVELFAPYPVHCRPYASYASHLVCRQTIRRHVHVALSRTSSLHHYRPSKVREHSLYKFGHVQAYLPSRKMWKNAHLLDRG